MAEETPPVNAPLATLPSVPPPTASATEGATFVFNKLPTPLETAPFLKSPPVASDITPPTMALPNAVAAAPPPRAEPIAAPAPGAKEVNTIGATLFRKSLIPPKPPNSSGALP